MRGVKLSLLLGTTAIIGMALWANAYVDRTAGVMATAASRFLQSLDRDQLTRAKFAFDDPERRNWHFIPRDRKGLTLRDMRPEQKNLAFGLLQSGLSRSGGLKATTIMSLEAILREMENDDGERRNPEKYHFSIFGEPSNQGTWGWRVEGHHLSLNFTVKDGVVTSATPAFFGANPAEVRQGPRSGLRTLADYEDRALRLMQALDESQQDKAIITEMAPNDVESNTGAGQQSPFGGLAIRPPSDEFEGLMASAMTADQKRMLNALIRTYALDMPNEVAEAWLGEVEEAGDTISFAWYGAIDRNLPHAYQVQGPTFQIEFNNTQNNANHIHALWRNTLDDFDQVAE